MYDGDISPIISLFNKHSARLGKCDASAPAIYQNSLSRSEHKLHNVMTKDKNKTPWIIAPFCHWHIAIKATSMIIVHQQCAKHLIEFIMQACTLAHVRCTALTLCATITHTHIHIPITRHRHIQFPKSFSTPPHSAHIASPSILYPRIVFGLSGERVRLLNVDDEDNDDDSILYRQPYIKMDTSPIFNHNLWFINQKTNQLFHIPIGCIFLSNVLHGSWHASVCTKIDGNHEKFRGEKQIRTAGRM